MNLVIIDTDCANIASVKFAIQRLGYHPVITSDKETIINADRLILPGVGTAQHAMENIKDRDLVHVIKQCTQPLLGICLGMQLLAKSSTEGSKTIPCLNILDIDITKLDSQQLPLPHIGWNQVSYPKEQCNPLFANIPNNSYFYFVHSYCIEANHHSIGLTSYGQLFSAAIAKHNFYGVQFHPERSSKAGAQLLQNFIDMPVLSHDHLTQGLLS